MSKTNDEKAIEMIEAFKPLADAAQAVLDAAPPKRVFRITSRGFYVMLDREAIEEWDAQETRESHVGLGREETQWMAYSRTEFVNLAESDACFGETPDEAVGGFDWICRARRAQRDLASANDILALMKNSRVGDAYRFNEQTVMPLERQLSECLAARPANVPEHYVNDGNPVRSKA